MTKKCTIVLRLVKEAEEKPNNELKEEISQELISIVGRIPWAREVENVIISEEQAER